MRMTREQLKETYWRKNLAVRKWILEQGSYVIIPPMFDNDPELSLVDRAVFGYLLSCIRPRGGGRCYPSMKRIAGYYDLGITTVQRSLLKLRRLFWIQWETTGRSHEYRIFDAAERAALMHVADEARSQRRKENLRHNELGQNDLSDRSF